jgi:hypothetical protein
MMLYTYLDERQTVRYWKKVAFNIIDRMVLNSYILQNKRYRRYGKLKSRYNYTLSIIESLGEECLVLKDNTGADDSSGRGGLKLFEKEEPQCIVCITKRIGGGDPEGYYAPDATRGCMENASLKTGANCKRYVCTVLHNVM